MKISFLWLKEYIATKLSAEKAAEFLTALGLEVDSCRQIEGNDFLFDISLTPNLVHCASHRGVARELAVITEEKICRPDGWKIMTGEAKIEAHTSVEIKNSLGCPRYACRLINNVKVAPSPQWLKHRLEICGMRSVNNVVDATNYVLLSLGHPLHAFNFQTLEENKIVVRNALYGESFLGLDNKEYFPDEKTLLICDGKKPIAIAGILGSKETEVDEKTTTILLEAAYFDPSSIRRACSHLDLHTEASYRFERGVDPNGVIEALEMATGLICALTNGKAAQGLIDIKGQEFTSRSTFCRSSQVNKILGLHFSVNEIENILKRLGFTIASVEEDILTVMIPTFRHDVQREIDLIEEIARVYGYDNIRKEEKAPFRLGLLNHAEEFVFEKKIQTLLLSQGLQEIVTCDLISPQEAHLMMQSTLPPSALISLLNPSSEEQSVLRSSLLPGLLHVVKTNIDYSTSTLACFEIGRVHFKIKEMFKEPTVASIVLTGYRDLSHWEEKENPFDFFDLKGMIENLMQGLKIPKVHFIRSAEENFHPFRQAKIMIEEIEVGIFGQIHPSTLQKLELNKAVFFAELHLEDLKRFVMNDIKMKPLANFPPITRDWTVTLEEKYPIGNLLEWIRGHGSSILESVELMAPIFRSEKLGEGYKNVTFRFVYRDFEKTLSVEEVEKVHTSFIDIISKKINSLLNEENS